jgi:AcrR family transcriptional regulator
MPSPTTRRLPKAERQAQLVRAAAAAFVDGGFDGTSMESVAERAGVTRLIVYRNFESKEALYRAVLIDVTEQLREEFDGSQPGEIAATLVRVARGRPDGFRLLWRHARHEPTFEMEARMFRLLADEDAASIVGRYIADATMRRWCASALVAYLLDGICTWLDEGDPERDDEFADRLSAGARALVDTWAD